jgi:signal transduction histidine kinase
MPIRELSQEAGFSVATEPATPLLRKVTLAVMAALLSIFLAAVFFANVPMAQSEGFIPFIQAAMIMGEIVTAVLLYTQFAILRSPAILVLASGYLFTALIILAHTLSFPRAFGPSGLLGAGLQTTGWLHIIWHFAYPASVIGYVLLKDKNENTDDRRTPSPGGSSIVLSVTVVCGLAFALIVGLIAGDAYVPRLFLDRTTFAPLAAYTGFFDTLVCVLAFVLLWQHQRQFLDRWLLIAIFATILEMAMVIIISGRFTLGWYAVRLFGVTASMAVFIALLTETMSLYARLADAIILFRRERTNRLMSLDAATAAMAHELRQPLTAIISSGSAAANWLNRVPPDLGEVRNSLALMTSSARSADEIIAGVRELFKKGAGNRTEVRIDDIVRHDLSLVQPDLQAGGIRVETELEADLPVVQADRTQLQQLILNLIRNAIEAMGSIAPGARRLRLVARREGHSSVVLSVQDSGPGITAEDAARVFEPFFTTKPGGMGLGLAICRTIAQDHGGDLRLAQSGPDGCVFEVALQTAAATYSDDGHKLSSNGAAGGRI